MRFRQSLGFPFLAQPIAFHAYIARRVRDKESLRGQLDSIVDPIGLRSFALLAVPIIRATPII